MTRGNKEGMKNAKETRNGFLLAVAGLSERLLYAFLMRKTVHLWLELDCYETIPVSSPRFSGSNVSDDVPLFRGRHDSLRQERTSSASAGC